MFTHLLPLADSELLHSLSDEELCFEKCLQFKLGFCKTKEWLIGQVPNTQTKQKMLGWKEKGKRRREGKHGGATGSHLLFFLSMTYKTQNLRPIVPLLQVTSDRVFTSPSSINSREESIGKYFGKDFENGKEYHERDVLLFILHGW